MCAKKSKLSKKEKARLEAEQAELQRIEMEKEKQRKLEEERKRKQLELEEAEKRQKLEIIENRVRRGQLKESVAYFTHITEEIERIRDEAKRQDEWEHYMRCNGLPSANSPGDLRKYIYMWSMCIANAQRHDQNWLLQTNERTILTQDRLVTNQTREHLRKSQANLGDTYARRIDEVLGVLRELDVAGAVGASKQLSSSTIDDLRQLKREIRIQLAEFIDDFTFRILSHVDRDMEYSAPGMSMHLYESAVFRTQVWMIQANAAKPNNKDKFKDTNRHTEVDFPLLNLQLTLPQSFQLINSTIRGLWLNYDHFSDYSPSYRMPNINLMHSNILQQTEREWKKRKEILKSTLQQVTKESSGTYDPLVVDSNDSATGQQANVIDVDKIYTEYADELNKARRKLIGPESLNLHDYEVNLRSHQIVGGLYCVDHLEQPQQDKRLNSSSFIRPITLPNRLICKVFYQPYKPPPAPQPGVRRLPEEIEAEMKAIERSLDKLATVTLQLPDHVLWFEPPIVCRWETPDETHQSEQEESVVATEPTAAGHRVSVVVEQRRSLRSNSIGTMPRKRVLDFDLYSIPRTVDIFSIMRDFVVPRLPDGYCVAIESDAVPDETQYLTKDQDSARPIQDVLLPSSSPRALHFEPTFDSILEITDDVGGESKYMFSELILDLENLCDLMQPYQDSEVEQINSKLSSTRSSRSEGDVDDARTTTRKFSSILIVRERESSAMKIAPKLADSMDDGSSSGTDEGEDEQAHDGMEDGVLEGLPAYYGRWSTRDVHDTKFNEDKLSIQFRTGRLGCFGFAANRYSNMPYQTWELKPDFKSPVIFTLTAAVISLEIQITHTGYRVNAFQGGTAESLNDLIGPIFTLAQLCEALTRVAVNIFPDEDAFCYTEGSCEKNYVMEMHLYACMAALGLSHNFSWSRWNLLSGSRAAVLLMRELQEGKKPPNHSTLYVTPLRASVVDCTEVSASFSMTGVCGMEFYADLYHLARQHSLAASKELQRCMEPMLRDHIYQLLKAVRPLSFC